MFRFRFLFHQNAIHESQCAFTPNTWEMVLNYCWVEYSRPILVFSLFDASRQTSCIRDSNASVNPTLGYLCQFPCPQLCYSYKCTSMITYLFSKSNFIPFPTICYLYPSSQNEISNLRHFFLSFFSIKLF